MTTAMLMGLMALGAGALAAEPPVQAPAVLQPLAHAVQAAPAEPPSIRVSLQISGNAAKAEAAVVELAGRYGGQRTQQAAGKPAGPAYIQIEFAAASLSTQRQLLDRVVAEIGAAGVGVLSGRKEELTPALEDRKAEVAKEAEALKAEQSSIRAALEKAPRISRIVDEQSAKLGAFSPQTEPRRGFLVVRLAAESSPAHEETPPFQEKPRQ